MPTRFRTYGGQPLFTEDYGRVFDFLVRVNADAVTAPHFLWSRWEWMIPHGALDERYLDRIGLWLEGDSVVGMATYESTLGSAYFIVDPGYAHLKSEMLAYAWEALAQDGKLMALIPDGDRAFQRIAREQGFRATGDAEATAVLDLTDPLAYRLPEGYRIVGMDEAAWDFGKYHAAMWRGFDHEGEPPMSEENLADRRRMLSGPHVDPHLVVCVEAPDGAFVSHCGMWCLPGSGYALVEPVATDPAYRRMGLGKAAVYEAARRCAALGAKQAFVGSSQEFYYAMGFAPYCRDTWWKSPSA